MDLEPEKITTVKHPARVKTGTKLVQYNKNKKLEKLNQISKEASIEKQVRPGFHFYFSCVIVVGGGVFYYFIKRKVTVFQTKLEKQSVSKPPAEPSVSKPIIPTML